MRPEEVVGSSGARIIHKCDVPVGAGNERRGRHSYHLNHLSSQRQPFSI